MASVARKFPVLQHGPSDALSKAPGFFKSLDYKNIARAAALIGTSVLAFKSLKLLIYGKAAAVAYDKAKGWARSSRQT
jgi:hypothetical protein